jgi:hypothetical protein
MQYDFFLRCDLKELEGETQEWCWLLTDAVSTADKGEVDGAIAEGGSVETEALLFPVVRVDYAIADGFFEEEKGILAADQGAGIAAVVEHAGSICLMRHFGSV